MTKRLKEVPVEGHECDLCLRFKVGADSPDGWKGWILSSQKTLHVCGKCQADLCEAEFIDRGML